MLGTTTSEFRNIRITRVRIVPVVVIELLVDLISKGGRTVVLRSNEMHAVAIENR